MMVQTGPIVAIVFPSRSRRLSPRSTASATAMHCGSVKQTVALMLTPRYVASSIAGIPARVTGILTIMLGASAIELEGLFHDRLAVAIKSRIGLDRQPAVLAALLVEDRLQQRRGVHGHFAHHLPRDFVFGGGREFLDQRLEFVPSTRHFFLQHADTMTGLQVAPTAPCSSE